MRRETKARLLVGFVLWIGSLVLFPLGYIERLLLFAFFITVPLALFVVEHPGRDGETSRLYRMIVRLHLPMAVIGTLSFAYPAGKLAGLLSLSWVLFTCLIGLYGLLRFLKRGFYFLEEFCIDAGLMYMTLGGFWFAAHRFDFDIMNFGSLIILLTAIHFHYSSLAVPIFTGLLGRTMEKTKLYRWMAAGNVISPLLIAVGITYSRTVEWLAVIFFACCLLVYVYYTFRMICVEKKGGVTKASLTLSSLSLLLTMGFAVSYGIGRGFGIQWVSIPTMVLIHGTGNTFGFVFLGLLAWTSIRPEARTSASGIPYSRLYGQWKIGAEFLEQAGWLDTSRKPVRGLVDDFSIYENRQFQPSRLHVCIRDFYERTLTYELTARVRWLRGFAFLSRLYKPVAEKIEQLNLPLNDEEGQVMEGTIVPVNSERDGRQNVRAWIRKDCVTGKTIFVAAYSHHTYEAETYMNIALPLPCGNMTGVLRLMHDETDGLILTSVPGNRIKGDEGIYYVFPYFFLRLPLNETFHVRSGEEESLYADHRMWIFGIPFLTISYCIKHKKPS
ncbi:YndJ family protein [Aneurinibacillus migulanus]|uniref:YndJ family protein n=1 Tax=Aneurinibacillus migulanus TaxID=47500 RepID=UPI002E1B6A68|nr:YndJ family protein [Aneurinibacillus migulanus]